MRYQISKSKSLGGFTLVEVMVAVSLFVVVAFTATTTFMVFSDANRRSQGLRASIDNLNFAMESIVLKMREGNNYTCVDSFDEVPVVGAGNCLDDGSPMVAFLADSGERLIYGFEESGVSGVGTIKRCVDNNPCEPIVSPAVDIEQVRFFVDNSNRPKVRIFLSAIVKDKENKEYGFELQTTISQRL